MTDFKVDKLGTTFRPGTGFSQAILTRFLPDTNEIEARCAGGTITIKCEDIIPSANHAAAAAALVKQMGWSGTYFGGLADDGTGREFVFCQSAGRAAFTVELEDWKGQKR